MKLKTLCLGLLEMQDATGYDIKQMFEQSLNHFHAASYGSIYPALKQLEQEGYVTSRIEAGDRHPDRRLFSLTDSGRRHFVEALEATDPGESIKSEFLVLMFFAHLLETRDLEKKLDAMLKIYDYKLDYLESVAQKEYGAGIRFSIQFGIEAIRAKRDFISRHRRQLLEEHRDTAGESPEKQK